MKTFNVDTGKPVNVYHNMRELDASALLLLAADPSKPRLNGMLPFLCPYAKAIANAIVYGTSRSRRALEAAKAYQDIARKQIAATEARKSYRGA